MGLRFRCLCNRLITFALFVPDIRYSFVFLPKIVKTKELNMLFAEKIKQLREERQLPQRQLAAELQIDTATYCKIERGDRRAKREQVVKLSELLHINKDDLISLWLADRIVEVVANENKLSVKAMSIASQILNNKTFI